MFDYKYSDISGITPKEFFNNTLLDFITPLSLKTGELNPCNNIDRTKKNFTPKDKREAIYNHCKFSITNNKYINFSGSLHEYHNNGTNHNDFTFSDLINVVTDLHQKFNLNPFLDHIHNLEFGVNITLPFKTKTFLNSIISFKGNEYELRRYKGKGYMIKFSFDQYELKIYDKGFQYQLPDEVLRFEIKVTTMQFLKAKGILIKTTSDLLNPDLHKRLGNLLIDFFKQLVVYDYSIKQSLQLKKGELNLLKEGQNPKYWSNLKEQNPETYKKRLARFRELIVKHGKENIQATVLELIKNKWENLCKIDPQTLGNLDNYLSKLNPQTFPEITDYEKTNFPQNKTSNSMLQTGNFSLIEKRFCKCCKRDISNQKKGSLFCSETLYGKEVKKCRNMDSNPRNNFKKREKKMYGGGNILFDVNPFLKNEFKERYL